jgi:hypothetical protein
VHAEDARQRGDGARRLAAKEMLFQLVQINPPYFLPVGVAGGVGVRVAYPMPLG